MVREISLEVWEKSGNFFFIFLVGTWTFLFVNINLKFLLRLIGSWYHIYLTEQSTDVVHFYEKHNHIISYCVKYIMYMYM